MDMSPFKIFMSCGSSSILVGLMTCPTPVILSSASPAGCGLPSFSASTIMERNFKMLNCLPPTVVRSCLKNTGPPSSILMARAVTSSIGLVMIRPIMEKIMSQILLTTSWLWVNPVFLQRYSGVSKRFMSSEFLPIMSDIFGVK